MKVRVKTQELSQFFLILIFLIFNVVGCHKKNSQTAPPQTAPEKSSPSPQSPGAPPEPKPSESPGAEQPGPHLPPPTPVPNPSPSPSPNPNPSPNPLPTPSPKPGLEQPPDTPIDDRLTSPQVLMSPHQGELAFEKLYGLIANAEKSVDLTIYSWSDSGLEKALMKAISRQVKIRVVLHPELKTSPKVINVVPELEKMGAAFKIAPINMHEKFVLIDQKILINSSANFSGGAKNRYSENMIFHRLDLTPSPSMIDLIQDFQIEFARLWNTSKDIVTHNEPNEPKDPNALNTVPQPRFHRDMVLVSSSMNWNYNDNSEKSLNFKSGRYQSLTKKMKPNGEDQTWTVTDAIIQAIDGAETSIIVCLNHFNIRAVSDALMRAVRRGVNVRLAVDNQEFKSHPNDIEMTPQFVQDYLEFRPNSIPPVRVKYYSHKPSPRNWLLNHHKYLLIDFESPDKTILLSGSFNLSETAEHHQFDNMVIYRGKNYRSLMEEFNREFLNQWFWNRTNDLPRSEVLALFYELKNDSYPLHIPIAVSLTWPEIMKLRSDIAKKAPGIFSRLGPHRDCLYYDPMKASYWGCPN